MFAGTIDGTDGAVSDDKSANIALWLVDILLDIVDMMLIGAKRLLVFEHSLRGITVIDTRQQASPRTGYRLEHHRVTQRLNAAHASPGDQKPAVYVASEHPHAAAPAS